MKKFAVLSTSVETGEKHVIPHPGTNTPQVLSYDEGIVAVSFMNNLLSGVRTYELVEYTETEIDENVSDTETETK